MHEVCAGMTLAPKQQFHVRILLTNGALFQVTIESLPDSLAGDDFEASPLLRPLHLFLDEVQAA